MCSMRSLSVSSVTTVLTMAGLQQCVRCSPGLASPHWAADPRSYKVLCPSASHSASAASPPSSLMLRSIFTDFREEQSILLSVLFWTPTHQVMVWTFFEEKKMRLTMCSLACSFLTLSLGFTSSQLPSYIREMFQQKNQKCEEEKWKIEP